jgi:hypothetical protein
MSMNFDVDVEDNGKIRMSEMTRMKRIIFLK